MATIGYSRFPRRRDASGAGICCLANLMREEKATMFSLGERKETTNPAILLESEQGTFRVISPSGDVSRYECLPSHSIASIEHLGTAEPRAQFVVEKIADGVSAIQVNFTPSLKKRAQGA